MRSSRKLIDACKASTQIYELHDSLHGLTLKQIRLVIWHNTGVKIGLLTLTKICHLHGIKIKWTSTQKTQAIAYYQTEYTTLK